MKSSKSPKLFDFAPIDLILFRIWNIRGEPTTNVNDAYKLSSTEGIHSLMCRTRRNINSAMQHLAWIAIGNVNVCLPVYKYYKNFLTGTAGFLTIGWLIRRRSKQREENEKTYKEFIDKIIEMLENQYEEHLRDPEVKPWLAVSHIRDMLIPTQDR